MTKPRARDLGIPFDGTPGPLNAITDVVGVEVGHVTLISGEGRLETGKGPVRTGVTAVLPRGKGDLSRVFAAWFPLNGNGELTGAAWLEESGGLAGPVLLTNTESVGVVRDAAIAWRLRRGGTGPDFSGDVSLPVVSETWDGFLNDIHGFHVKPEHAWGALDGACGGPVPEGSVGGGTGMICHRFKAGIGTASRRVRIDGADRTVGVLVQANYGTRESLRIAGVPVGREIADLRPERRKSPPSEADQGSIVGIVATDAPLLPHQLKRLAKRAPLGLARMGGTGGNGSGDLFLAFSTANPEAVKTAGTASLTMLPNDRLNALFDAVVESTEEAIANALVAAEDMTGIDGNRAYAIPHGRLREAMRKFGR